MRYFPALFFFLFSCTLSAQMESQQSTLNTYVENYNAQRSVRDWASTERTDVSFAVEDGNMLVATLEKGGVRIDLDRSSADPMDGLFPLTVKNMTVVFTNATILFIDPEAKHHLGFTLLDEPELPAFENGYLTIFMGNGIGRRSLTE